MTITPDQERKMFALAYRLIDPIIDPLTSVWATFDSDDERRRFSTLVISRCIVLCAATFLENRKNPTGAQMNAALAAATEAARKNIAAVLVAFAAPDLETAQHPCDECAAAPSSDGNK